MRDEPEKYVRSRRVIALLADAVLLTLASPLLAIWAIGAGLKRLVRGKQN